MGLYGTEPSRWGGSGWTRIYHAEQALLTTAVAPSGRKTNNPEGEFSQKGQLLIPPERHPRDSGYALYLASLMAGHGDPGRFIEEYRKEHKNRRQGVLLSWAQVEYYQVPSGMKKVLIRRPRRVGRNGNAR